MKRQPRLAPEELAGAESSQAGAAAAPSTVGFSLRRFGALWTPMAGLTAVGCPCCAAPLCLTGGLFAGVLTAVLAVPFCFKRTAAQDEPEASGETSPMTLSEAPTNP